MQMVQTRPLCAVSPHTDIGTIDDVGFISQKINDEQGNIQKWLIINEFNLNVIKNKHIYVVENSKTKWQLQFKCIEIKS